MTSPGVSKLGQSAGGHEQALAKLLEEHGPVVRRGLVGQIPRCWQSVLSVDDVMQQTYTDAFLDIDRFVPTDEGSFTAWLMSLAKCNLIDTLRMFEAEKRGKDYRRIEPSPREASWVALYERLSFTGSTPSRHAAREEACTAMEWALQQLPEAYRRVVQMYDLENRPMEEVARALGRSPGAVYMVRVRAHRRLRELLGSPSKYFSSS